MDKTRFLSLISHYTNTSVSEAEEIESLANDYPYSQLLHTLRARASKDHQLNRYQDDLQVAAVHAADRAVLKDIMTFMPEDGLANENVAPASASPLPAASVDKAEITTEQRIYSIASVDVADELMKDLEKLNTLRHNFELLFVEYSEVSVTSATPAEAVSQATPDEQEGKEEAEHVPKRESQESKEKTKSRKERIIELARAMSTTDTKEKMPASPPAEEKKKRVSRHSDELIEYIRDSKEEIVPESDKQKEQIEIINQFIKSQPSISNAKDRAAMVVADLNPIKSGEFSDNIVSETLVEILVKQGKKDKAIEVLKKLIWKFPQKKAYFASQIEDLKK